jgi:hypothetical protein
VGDIIETSPSDDHGAESESADGLESSSPPGNANLAKEIRRKRTQKQQIRLKHTLGASAGVEYLASWTNLGARLVKAWVTGERKDGTLGELLRIWGRRWVRRRTSGA